MNTHDTENAERPLGYWLKATDRLLAAQFAAAFENEGITRREWRLLNIIDGSVPTDRRLPEHKLGRLIEREWITRTDDGWTLTDEGRAAKERLGAAVDGIRLTASDAVSPEDYATTIATLEKISRAYGWEEGIELPRGHRRGRHGFGHGRGHRHGFGHGRGFDRKPGHGRDFDPREGFAPEHGRPFGPRHGFGPHEGHGRRGGSGRGEDFGPRFDPRHEGHGHDGHRHGGHGHGGHGPARAAIAVQHAYERGFDAGFDRGTHAG